MAFIEPASPPPVFQPLPLIFPGPLAVLTGNIKVPLDHGYTIVGVRATVGTPSVGAPVIADILANGVSIFTTSANRPTVLAGNNLSAVTVPDSAQLTENTLLQLAVTQVGSTFPGSDLCVLISMQRNP